ncbi:restriction modification system DNA specificity subunit [Sediminicola sp. YIK13]|uniref:restriction endonuclease subunit S n=1 Tax=Sediminicola sp. YIK13 TaxID=1453352 RepID=UPI000720DD76|nr:restriction endonuclease subunit S [Sediminicola sp. YIK13]ALM07743.1 restriction modification system DNA specificity subunit [Sediminicola sp. YIK13]
MNTKKFDDIFWFGPKSKIKAGDGLDEGRFPFYTSSSILKKFVNTEQFFDEALIFGTGGSASVHYANEPFSTSTDCIVAIARDENFNTKFVYYYLFGNLHLLERGFKGAGLKHISKKYIQKLDIPILPIEAQNKIVSLLDKASELVQKREDSITLLDELLSSQFLRMFGKANEQFDVWGDVQIKSLALNKKNSMRTGPFGSNLKHTEFVESGPVAVLGIDNAVKNTFQWKEKRYITNEKYEDLKRYTVFPRDVIITIMGTVGRSAVIPEDIPTAINTKHLACISLDPKKCNPYYLAYSIHSNPYISYQMKAQEKGAIMAGLNLTIIKDLKLKDVPIELQNKFETIYHNIQVQKETLIQSKTELENLYNSLLQRAFSGQLNFNVDAELDVLLAAIDVDKEENDIRDIATVYASRLLERLDSQDFENQTQYQQAKQVAFQMLKEGAIEQEYDVKDSAVKMKLV